MIKRAVNYIFILMSFIVYSLGFVFTINAQNSQLVPNPQCVVSQDTGKCFSLATQTISVGKEVTSLGDLYKFCTTIIQSVQGKPSRVVMVLDNSSSMCQDEKNDPTNVRVLAANAFVDSAANNCPACEIGVIVYKAAKTSTSSGTISHTLNPLNVGSAANVSAIHAIVNLASCGSHSAPKTQEASGLAKTTTTWTGTALDSAVQGMIDLGYDSLVAAGLGRNIILMTDGDWQTPVSADIYTEYITKHPGRPFPTIHGVYLQAVGGSGVPYDLTNMQQATQLSTRNAPPNNAAGLYFPGTTPQTIVATFNTLFQSIVASKAVGLQTVTFTNTTVIPPDSRAATIFLNGGTTNQYSVRVPGFALRYGVNTFTIAIQVKDTSGAISTSYDTLTLIRSTATGSGSSAFFKTQCGLDTVPISITCNPLSLQIPAYDSVFAKLARPQDTSIFLPNDITLRAFVPFPDNEQNTLALFHLDNNLVNSAPAGAPGTGTPTYSSDNAAFNAVLKGGSFSTNLALPITSNSDFTAECWIKPAQSASIVSGAGFKFEVTSDNYLSATIGTSQIKTNHSIDNNVWQHVAVARLNGSINLYINGIPMTSPMSAPGAISGTLTIGPVSGMLDEFRLSNTVHTQTILGVTTLQIPLVPQLLWKINAIATTGQTASLPASLWQGKTPGQVQFQFSSPVAGPVIINFFDTSSSPISLMWSKNGDPVTFTTTGLSVSATLRDSTHDGHLDVIDLKWTDNSTMNTPLPNAGDLISSMVITTIEGKTDTLRASSITLDNADKSIHIFLKENNTSFRGNYETGWLDAKITLNNVKMTSDGRPLVVTKVIDGAAPIPAGACYAPAPKADSLYITFSEPLPPKGNDTTTVQSAIILYQKDTLSFQTLLSLNPSTIKNTSDGRMLFVFPFTGSHVITPYGNFIGEHFSTAPNSPQVGVDYCYAVSLIDKVRIGPNPSTPNVTPPATINVINPNGNAVITKGIKVEVIIKRQVRENGKQFVFGTMMIFDAVGNCIQDKIPLLPEVDNPMALALGWDGKNRRGMIVAGGTYLTRIRIWSINNQNQISKDEYVSPPALIGIKTKN